MKKRLTAFLLICAVVISLSANVSAVSAKYAVKDALTGATTYGDDFAQLVSSAAAGSVVTLQRSVQEDITVSKNLQLELNGKTVTGTVTVESGVKLQVSDTATADYDISDGVYGKIKTAGAGTVTGAAATESSDVYLMAEESDGYVSFHAVGLNIDEMVLRPEIQGIYFMHQFRGDTKVKAQVASYGIAFSLVDGPSEADLKAKADSTKTLSNTVKIMTAGDVTYTKHATASIPFGQTDAASTSTLITGIMKEENGNLTNRRNAKTLIHGAAYVCLANGDYHLGVNRQRSLQQQVELVCDKWEELTKIQQNAMLRSYRITTYNKVMKNWTIPNLVTATQFSTAATSADTAALAALYADRTAYHGDLHDHADTGGTSDGRQTLATWKSMMADLKMDFTAILDHKQFLHMDLPEWDEEVFIGGSEAAGVITDRPAGANNYHYDLVFADKEAAERVVSAFSEFGYKEYTSGEYAGQWHFTYPNFTAARFNKLITKVKEEGGLFSIAHPSSSNATVPENALDLYFQDHISFMVFYGYGDTDNHNFKSDANYKLWTDMLAAGKRIWATAGYDGHNYPTTTSLSTIYSESRKASDHMTHLRVGDFTAGAVGVKMCVGDTAMGSTGTFEDQRVVFTVGDFHETLQDHKFKVSLLDDAGTVFTAEMTGTQTKTFAIDADSNARFYRVEIYDKTTNTLAALGNPIWNSAFYQD